MEENTYITSPTVSIIAFFEKAAQREARLNASVH